MTQDHPVVERYLASLESAMKAFDFNGAKEIESELRNHIAEATAAGKPLDAVLEALGPAETLARAYAVELALNRRGARLLGTIGGAFRILGIVAAGSIVTFLVVAGLGSIGIGAIGSGLGMFVIGVLEAVGIHLPEVQMNGVSPIVPILAGPLLILVGLLALAGLYFYARFLTRALMRILPQRGRT